MANFTCFVDFQKALDKVWRTDLLYKLLKFSIRGKFYDMIKNIYSKTYSYITRPTGLMLTCYTL